MSFDNIALGKHPRFGSYHVTRDEVIEFASRYDPQRFHLDDKAAEATFFGRLAASGWHTASMTMRMIVDHWREMGIDEKSIGGMGVDDLKWLVPVYPGDTLSCEMEILEKRLSKSQPDRGIVRCRWSAFNQDNIMVCTYISTGIFLR